MKKFLLSTLALATGFVVNAQNDSNHVCTQGFIMQFDSEDRVTAIDTTGTADDTRMGVDWWGCGFSEDRTDCAEELDYIPSIADGKLSIATTKGAVSDEGLWTPFGFSTLDGAGTKSVDISAHKSIQISYTNTASVGLEVYFGFIFEGDNITADPLGASIGGPIGAGETIVREFDLDYAAPGVNWCLSEAACAALPDGTGGNPDGGPACSVVCNFSAYPEYTKFQGMEITITGANDATTGYAAMTGEVVEFDYIRSGAASYNACNGVSTEEVVVNGLNIYPNPASDVLNVNFDANSATTVELIDLTGKVVETSVSEAGTVTTSFQTVGVNAGVYFVNIKNVNGSTTSKVVIK